MKTLIFVFAAVASSLGAAPRTFADKMLGDQPQRQVGSTVISYNPFGQIQIVEIEAHSRTIFVADAKDGHLIYYYRPFNNCDRHQTVVRYALHDSIVGMKEGPPDSMVWQCSVSLKLATIPVGSDTKRGISIRLLFERVALKYQLPHS